MDIKINYDLIDKTLNDKFIKHFKLILKNQTIKLFNLDQLVTEIDCSNNKELLIGRDPKCRLNLHEVDGVSKIHGKIMLNNANELELYDQHSLNGIYINDRKIDEQLIVLKPGDKISIGLALIIYSID